MLSFAQEQKLSLTSRFQRIKRRAQRFDESFLRSVGVTPAKKNGNTLKLEMRRPLRAGSSSSGGTVLLHKVYARIDVGDSHG